MAQTLSEAGQSAVSPQVAVDSQDRATVVWIRFDGTNQRIQSVRGVILFPDTQIDSGPAEWQTINDANPSFAFSGSPAASVDRFECRVDSGAFAACASPHTTAALADGPHTFAVRTVDSDGPDPTPAQRSFTVDTPPGDDSAPRRPPTIPRRLAASRSTASTSRAPRRTTFSTARRSQTGCAAAPARTRSTGPRTRTACSAKPTLTGSVVVTATT